MADTVPYRGPEARELTKEEHEQWVNKAFNAEQRVKGGLRSSREGLWEAAEALYEFSEEAGWYALGYETLGEWLASPDITLTRRTYFRMVSAWRELVVIRQVPSANVGTLDLTKVDIALPALRAGKATVADVLADVEELGAQDLREKYVVLNYGGQEAAYEPTQDGVDDNGTEPEHVTPDAVLPPEEELYGPATIPRGVAQTVTIALEAVMAAHPIERKSMSRELHSLGEQALEIAHAEGLGNV